MENTIKEALSYFTTKTLKGGDDTIVVLKDDAPESLRDSIHEAHGDRMPDDWIYGKYQSILADLSGYTITCADDIEENRAEIVDGLVDAYTSDLTAWLNISPHNVYYMTEAQEEYGAQEDGFKILQMAQYKAIDEIYGEVANYLKSKQEAEE